MPVTVALSGERTSFEREISEDTVPKVTEIVVDYAIDEESNGNDDSLIASLSGDWISLERQISRPAGARLIEVSMAEGKSKADDASLADNEEGALPASFFKRLTSRQEAFVKILLEADDWMLNEDIRQKMGDEYGLSSSEGQAIAGILSGFTRKYGKDFRTSLVENRWAGNQVKYRLNRDEGFEEELRAGLDG